MANDLAAEAMAGIRAALVGDADVAALVGDRVVDDPEDGIALPYVRFGLITPVPDDTDATRGAVLTIGLNAHSRPIRGRLEAGAICGAIHKALHKRPEVVTALGYTVTELQVQTWVVRRAGDGATYEGALSLEIRLEE